MEKSTVEKQSLSFDAVAPFHLEITYADVPPKLVDQFQHGHPLCEIVFLLDGDISFMVEDTIYPVAPGSIILTRPYEQHHCIFHSPTRLRHYWLLFSALGNEPYLDLFFDRPLGQGNLIHFSAQQTAQLASLCRELMHPSADAPRRYYLFFRMLELIRQGTPSASLNSHLRPEIARALETIHSHLGQPLSVKALAQDANMSLRTFERNFSRDVGMTPHRYQKQWRLAASRAYLLEGNTVTETALQCGFADAAHYIAEFRKTYGVTPLKFKSYAREGQG